MTTVYQLRARRAQLVQDRAECIRWGMPPDGVDLALFNVDRQLQQMLGDDDEEGEPAGTWLGDLLLCAAGVALIALAVWWGVR